MTSRAGHLRLIIGLAVVIGVLVPAARPEVVHAAEYTMETVATYAARPDDGEIDVRVEVAFTNTTPDPAGQFSIFDEVRLAIHDQAASVAVTDEEGDLEVGVAVEEDVNVATVSLREDLRFEDTASFELTYVLPDTDDPQLRVRPSVVVFPAWSFGTSGSVSVTVPDGYEVRFDGDALTEESGAYVSGPIEDPARWLALVTATRPIEYTSFDATVPLEGGTADLVVRSFADDEAWGERTLDLITRALPLLEEELGLPYPRLGQLVVTESIAADTSGFAEELESGTEIVVAFDQPPFTAIHQAAHVWISAAFVEDRWLREGLASDVAARVAEQLEIALPYDPAERAEQRSADGFRLDTWAANAGPAGEAFGYAASWAFIDELEASVGLDAIRTVLARVAAGVGPYQAAEVEPEPLPDGVAAPAAPLTTRSFLDHLETVASADLAPTFAERVLTDADAALLPARAEARSAFADLVSAADGWGAPDPIRAAMTAWEFDVAAEQIAAASAWLEDRNDLLDRMRSAGLSAPDRLQQAWRSYGGGGEAVAELEAEASVVDAYAGTAREVTRERTFLERIGLIGAPDPAVELAMANGHFADGDLRDALDATNEAQRMVAAAETGGIVRIASVVLVAVLVLAVAVILVRRRSSYTARR